MVVNTTVYFHNPDTFEVEVQNTSDGRSYVAVSSVDITLFLPGFDLESAQVAEHIGQQLVNAAAQIRSLKAA